MSAKKDLVRILEAAYHVDLDEDAWLLGVALAVQPALDCGQGVIGWYYDATVPGELRTHGFLGLGAEKRTLERLRGNQGSVPKGRVPAGIPISFVSHAFGAACWRELISYNVRHTFQVGWKGVHVFNAADPTGYGCMLGAAGAKKQSIWGTVVWGRLAAHIAAGLRIRRRLQKLSGRWAQVSDGEAVLTPDGKIEHAEGPAKETRARSALRRAALAADRARGPLRRTDPAQAITVWQGLVDGRWTLLDHFEKSGRRYLVAHRNDPRMQSPRALTLRERQVLAYAALGHSTKLIAYELGLSVGAASAYLAGAMRKIGLRSRVQLVNLGAKLARPVKARS
jgi:DNA-binding CsgD family transcriptional regulator